MALFLGAMIGASLAAIVAWGDPYKYTPPPKPPSTPAIPGLVICNPCDTRTVVEIVIMPEQVQLKTNENLVVTVFPGGGFEIKTNKTSINDEELARQLLGLWASQHVIQLTTLGTATNR